MKKILKKIVNLLLGKKISILKLFVAILRLLRAYFSDFSKFRVYSLSKNYLKDKYKLESNLLLNIHKIEKGLSLSDVRLGFGSNVIELLINDCSKYIGRYGKSEFITKILQVLNDYYCYHQNHTYSNEIVIKLGVFIEKSLDIKDKILGKAYKTITKSELSTNISNEQFHNFLLRRVSVRNFDKEMVRKEDIYKSIEMAIQTPSACNRQGWKVRLYYSELEKDKALSVQQGNRGFGAHIRHVLLVTGDLRSFMYKERNQAFVDGGLFSMTLVYALHSFNIGSCMLNTTYDTDNDKKFRQVLNIPNYEVPICMIAIGYLLDINKIASSPRKDLIEVLVNK